MTIGEARHGLRKLGATESNKHHRIYVVYCDSGHLVGTTRMSHKPTSTQLPQKLISAMAVQLQIPRRLWMDIAGCSQDRLGYLVARDHHNC